MSRLRVTYVLTYCIVNKGGVRKKLTAPFFFFKFENLCTVSKLPKRLDSLLKRTITNLSSKQQLKSAVSLLSAPDSFYF